jgi:hypothetical protein
MLSFYLTFAIPASLPGPGDEASPSKCFSMYAREKTEESGDETTSSFEREHRSRDRLARTLLVFLSHTPVDGVARNQAGTSQNVIS